MYSGIIKLQWNSKNMNIVNEQKNWKTEHRTRMATNKQIIPIPLRRIAVFVHFLQDEILILILCGHMNKSPTILLLLS